MGWVGLGWLVGWLAGKSVVVRLLVVCCLCECLFNNASCVCTFVFCLKMLVFYVMGHGAFHSFTTLTGGCRT